MNIVTVNIKNNKKLNPFDRIWLKLQHKHADCIVVNEGSIANLNHYNIDYVINIFLPLIQESNIPLIIETSLNCYFRGNIGVLSYYTMDKKRFTRKEYLVTCLFNFSKPISDNYTLLESDNYSKTFRRNSIQNEFGDFNTIFQHTLPKYYNVDPHLHSDSIEELKVYNECIKLGFYKATNNRNYIPLAQPDNCTNCLYYVGSTFLRCTANPMAVDKCKVFVRK